MTHRKQPSPTARLAAIALLILGIASNAWAGERGLERFMERQMAKAQVPGLSAALVVDGQLAWSAAYGWADIQSAAPVTTETIFLTASVSKLFTATAIMQLVERGKIDLDEDISSYLPVAVRNPAFPDQPITARQLLTHTSSISDARFVEIAEEFFAIGDWPGGLADFLVNYLIEGGAYYRAGASFSSVMPGTRHEYTNVGFSLLGGLIEAVSGKSFESYLQRNVLRPLGMARSSFYLSPLVGQEIAVPYQRHNGTFEAYPHYGASILPSSMLRTSADQLANFLAMYLRLGEFNGQSVLNPASIDEMLRIQFPDISPFQGLGFVVTELGGYTHAVHTGAMPGVSTEVRFEIESEVGLVILTNGEPLFVLERKQLRAFHKIRVKLLKKAKKLAQR